MAEFQYLNGLNSDIQDKQAEAYLFAPSGTVGIAATGVIEGLVVRQTSTASGSVLIDAGACLNQASLGQGADRLINPSQKTLDIFTANPVGSLPRNDIIEFDSTTTLISVRVGTPNATPSDPTSPATSVRLSRLRHLSPGGIGATTIPTAQIDTLIVPTVLRGVLVPAVTAKTTAAVATAGGAVSVPVVTAPNITGDGVKKFKITASIVMVSGTVVTDHFYFKIIDATLGTNVLDGILSPFMTTTAGIFAGGATFTAYDVPAVGPHGYRLDYYRAFGTGIGTVYLPAEIIVEQIA